MLSRAAQAAWIDPSSGPRRRAESLPGGGRRRRDGESRVTYLWVAAGGALGSVARVWLTLAVTAYTGPRFPWATLLINIGGSLVIGWFGALTGAGGRIGVSAEMRAFVMAGLCGGFTTFSAFSAQALELLREGEVGRAAGYILGSVVLCLLAVWAGFALGRV